jgi:hypothetical protein
MENIKAGKRWTSDEDELLLKHYNEDKLTIPKICVNHKRLAGGITSRLILTHKIAEFKENLRGFSDIDTDKDYLELKREYTIKNREKKKEREVMQIDKEKTSITLIDNIKEYIDIALQAQHDKLYKRLSIIEKRIIKLDKKIDTIISDSSSESE